MSSWHVNGWNHNAIFHRGPEGYFYAHNAVIVGQVKLAQDANIWYGSVIRGDDAPITIGERVNIQDLTMVHADPDKPLTVGNDVTVGHRAILHCRSIGNCCLIGMGSVLMEDVEIGDGSLVAAGSVVVPGTIVPPNSLVRGTPARVARETTAEERAAFLKSAAKYAAIAAEYVEYFPGATS